MNKLYIKWTLALIAMLMLALFSSCLVVNVDDDGDDEKDEIASESFQYTLAAMGKQHLNLANVNGSVVIHGDTDVDSIYIQGQRIVRAVDEDDAENGLTRLRVEIQTVGDAVNIESIHPKSTSAKLTAGVVNGSVNVSQLSMSGLQQQPKRVEGTLGSGNGEIKLSAVNGNISVTGK